MTVFSTKIALVGYGSMGKEIERIAQRENVEITDIFDINNPFDSKKKYDFEVAIEFTEPSSVLKNVEELAKAGKHIVLGTTGWYDKKDEIEKIVEKHNIGLVWAANFSLGMNIFFKLVEVASMFASISDEYDMMVHELHHKHKKDSPSGTAERIGAIILENFINKKEILKETSHKKIKPDQLHVTSTRGGEIFGTHTVYVDSLADTIELTHRARTREGFAIGAISAAEIIAETKGFHEFNELIL